MGRASQDYSVDPRCFSVKFEDGTEYPVRDGRVTIDRPEHIDELSTSSQVQDGWMHKKKHIFHTVRDEKECTCCGFIAFPFTRVCPRCHNTAFEVPST